MKISFEKSPIGFLHGDIKTTVIQQEVDYEIKLPGQGRRQVAQSEG